MSRSVAGFVLLLASVVSAQIQLKGTGNEPSIVVDSITGGSYPAGAFSIGYGAGGNNPNGGGGHGANYGTNGRPGYDFGNSDRPGQNYGSKPDTSYGTNGGNGQFNPNYGNGHRQFESGYTHGENGISNGGLNNYNGQNGPANGNGYGVYNPNNPGQKPTNPYDSYSNQNNAYTPVRNSASRYTGFWNYLFSLF